MYFVCRDRTPFLQLFCLFTITPCTTPGTRIPPSPGIVKRRCLNWSTLRDVIFDCAPLLTPLLGFFFFPKKTCYLFIFSWSVLRHIQNPVLRQAVSTTLEPPPISKPPTSDHGKSAVLQGCEISPPRSCRREGESATASLCQWCER